MKEYKNPNPMRLLNLLEKYAYRNPKCFFSKIMLNQNNRVIYVAGNRIVCKVWLVDLDTYQTWSSDLRFTTLRDAISYSMNNQPLKMNKATLSFRSFLDKHKDKF